jgi:hypothetical protein
MDGVDPRSFEFALQKIDDGFIFEDFAQRYLGATLGYDFLPAGGLKDRGIGGLQHTFHRKGFDRSIYQASIEKFPAAKLARTLETLTENQIAFEALYFVTNQEFKNKDVAVDELFAKYQKRIIVYDLSWLSIHINDNPQTLSVFHVFVASYLHDFTRPGTSYTVSDLVNDPRLFVFLRQQWDENKQNHDLAVILADTLILYGLEGTDPDKQIFKTTDELKSSIAGYIKFDPRSLDDLINRRLKTLSSKPRKIHFHDAAAGYCLPYDTRLRIQERNLRDASLHKRFTDGVEAKLKHYLKVGGVSVSDSLALIEATLHQLFYQQGLEFADFVLRGENQKAFEKRLPDIIRAVVDESAVIPKNKEEVKTSLLITLRDLIYNGSADEKEFLSRLSHTYMMLFLLQFDPKLSIFFNAMASRLTIYVCTSIIIPALSEFYLDPPNRRHWNLLKQARNAGVTLVVNDAIIKEITSHFRMIISEYEEQYKDVEDVYLADELMILYIDQIMIRAYFYSKMRGHAETFREFIDNFVTPDLKHADSELTEWLKTEFGIQYRSDASLGCSADREEAQKLFEILKQQKTHAEKAKSDANLILTIYALRALNNENNGSGIFGYRTWWLSKDTLTQRAVNEAFKDKYGISCYIRPDFLYNYICLTPSRAEIDAAYENLFPSLVGVNISFHLPKEILTSIHKGIRQHKDKNRPRLTATLRDLADRMKVDPTSRSRHFVEHFLDERLKGLAETK